MAAGSQPFTVRLRLDRVTALAMEPGARATLRGCVSTSLDGSSFDAAQVFDLAAGGLRIVDADPQHFAYGIEATGRNAPGCADVGSPSPCLMPRLASLAHDRLHTVAEFASTLSGSVEMESPTEGGAPLRIDGALSMVALCAATALGIAGIAIALLRRLARSALGRVRLAARRALRATRSDPTLAPVQRQIRLLVDRATQVDAHRKACARELGRLERRSAAGDGAADATCALASLSTEREASARIENDHAHAVTELKRIESILRVVTLRSVARAAGPGRTDLVDALVAELDLRDEAIAEAEGS